MRVCENEKIFNKIEMANFTCKNTINWGMI